ncbi:DUF21 domain-containing protein [Capnocytophaga canimorsus]|nr:DUF21 domain-containing protein [Capnocytophaga canimorsus]WGU69782.1 DUF21 domain-containing protein [Capnocytophaga canimorsus]
MLAREDGTPTGKIIANLLDSPKKLLATILIANNLINISIVLLFVDLGDFLFGKVDYQLFGVISLKTIIDVGLVTFFNPPFLVKFYLKFMPTEIIVFFANKVAYPLYVLDILFSPLSLPMRNFTVWIHKKIRTKNL